MSRQPFRHAALLWVLLIAACAGATDDKPMNTLTPRQAAETFIPLVETALAGLPIDRESVQVRANPCEGAQGEVGDDRFYIWVGLRGGARAGNASEVIDEAQKRWNAEGWEITRFRTLDNGGRNLAATDPAGNTYVLDSGFRNASASALAGFFNTPCMQSSEGKVEFGELAI